MCSSDAGLETRSSSQVTLVTHLDLALKLMTFDKDARRRALPPVSSRGPTAFRRRASRGGRESWPRLIRVTSAAARPRCGRTRGRLARRLSFAQVELYQEVFLHPDVAESLSLRQKDKQSIRYVDRAVPLESMRRLQCAATEAAGDKKRAYRCSGNPHLRPVTGGVLAAASRPPSLGARLGARRGCSSVPRRPPAPEALGTGTVAASPGPEPLTSTQAYTSRCSPAR